MSELPEEIAILLTKAARDLKAATGLLGDDDLLDVVCFHAQQAAEKALKALLVACGVRYPYRHDLDELLELLPEIPLELATIRDELSALTPFATTERYEEVLRPSRDEATTALATARQVHDVVTDQLCMPPKTG